MTIEDDCSVFPRSSIKRLRFAFAAIAGLTLLALTVGCVTFVLSYSTQQQLADETTPLLINIEQLSKVTIAFSSASRELEAVDNQDRLDRLLRRYTSRSDALQRELLKLADLGLEADAIGELNDVVRQLESQERTYVAILNTKIDATAKLADIRREIFAEGQALQDRIAPLVLTSSLSLIDNADASRGQDETKASMLAEILNETQLLTDIGFAAERFLHAVGRSDVGSVTSSTIASRESLAPEFRRLTQLVLKLRDRGERQALAELLQVFEEKALGEGGLTDQAKEIGAVARRLEGLNQQRTILLARLTDLVDKIVTEARSRFIEEADAVQQRSLIAVSTLILFSVVALVAAIWIGLRLINRDIAQRLDRLSTSTVALAAGDLDVVIDQSGSDELADMARATETFRRNAQALRRAEVELAERLIEVQGANERLLEANGALDKANAELAESELRYQLAVQGSTVGIWDWDAQTNTLFWSDRMKQMLGMTNQASKSDLSSFFDRLHPDDRALVMERRRRHVEEGTEYDVECRLRREDGSYVWIHNRGKAVWDESGRLKRIAGSADDITERKTVEIQLAQYARELERSNHELDQFAYIASHDLKEPLRAVYNHASFLLEDYSDKLDDDGEKRLNRLIKLSERMEKLIADLLYFSRLGRGEQTMDTLDLNDAIADIEGSLRETLASRNAKIIVPETLPPISGHPAHITALFQNLISNGTKYNDAQEKVIEIGHALTEDDAPSSFVTLYVKDNGIGIDEQFKDDIFHMFKRLNAEKVYGEGTGAGLTFVKKIVENHGGRIWLRSRPGEGTTFFFTLREAIGWKNVIDEVQAKRA